MKPDSVDVLAPILAKYKAAQDSGRILYINFTSVHDYFWLLRAACECLTTTGPRAMLYLAAAVSDFYVPSNQLVSSYYHMIFRTCYHLELINIFNYFTLLLK